MLNETSKKYFKYHPAKTQERIDKHNKINDLSCDLFFDSNKYKDCYDFLFYELKDPGLRRISLIFLSCYCLLYGELENSEIRMSKKEVFELLSETLMNLEDETLKMFLVQTMRMVANQDITYQEINK